ncbi:T9SS type A sorting domain-containing protein [Candidatus Latescibacterota bacterium]
MKTGLFRITCSFYCVFLISLCLTVTHADGEVIFTDDFNDNSISSSWSFVNTEGLWEETSGEMNQRSNFYDDTYNYAFSGGVYSLVGEETWSEYDVSVEMRSSDDGRIGVVFFYRDENNLSMFVWEKENPQRVLVNVVNGVETVLASDQTGFSENSTYHLNIKVSGTNTTVTINDAEVFSAGGISIPQGKAGLFASGNDGCYWDNFTITSSVSVVKPGTQTLFADSFNNSIVSKSWTLINGSWDESNGTFLQNSNFYDDTYDLAYKGGAYAIVGDTSWSNYDLSVDMMSSDDDRIGIVFNYQDEYNFYMYVQEQQFPKRVLLKVVDGSETVLASDEAGYTVNAWYNFNIQTSSTGIIMYLNNIQFFNVADTTFSSGGTGFFASGNDGSYWDNFNVYSSGGTVDPGLRIVFSDDFNDNQIDLDWEVLNGTWSESNGEMIQTNNYYDGTYDYAYSGGVYTLTDTLYTGPYSLSLNIKSSDDDRIGAVFYYQDSQNFYMFVMDSELSKRVLVRVVNGEETILASDDVPYTSGTWYILNITNDDNGMTVSLDNTQLFNVTDNTFSSGRAGLFASGNDACHWDNFIMTGGKNEILPPTDVVIADVNGDNGHTVRITWSLSDDDNTLTQYNIYRSRSSELTDAVTPDSFATLEELIEAEKTTTILLGNVQRGQESYTDLAVPLNGVQYYYWVEAVSGSGASEKIIAGLMTSVDDQPVRFSVSAPYPNPFNSTMMLTFTIAVDSRVKFVIYDILGREVEVVSDDILTAGSHRAVWDGRDRSGSMAASGVYFYRLSAGNEVMQGKAVFVR